MTDIIVAVILAVIIGGAAWYVYKEKKSGTKCIGCPSAKNCAGRNGSSCGGSCGCHTDN